MNPLAVTLLSFTVSFSGQCWQPKFPLPGWEHVAEYVNAWTPKPISIVAASLDVVVEARWPWQAIEVKGFLGNSATPDAMTPTAIAVGRGKVVLHAESPAAMMTDGMAFPAMTDAHGPAAPHLDAHVQCSARGAHYSGSMTFWYRLNGS